MTDLVNAEGLSLETARERDAFLAETEALLDSWYDRETAMRKRVAARLAPAIPCAFCLANVSFGDLAEEGVRPAERWYCSGGDEPAWGVCGRCYTRQAARDRRQWREAQRREKREQGARARRRLAAGGD